MPAFYIVLRAKVPGVDAISLEGRALSKNDRMLEELAKAKHVPSLVSFFSASKEELEGFLEDDLTGPPVGVPIPEERWYPAEDGLNTIRTLIGSLEKSALPDNPQLIRELREFEQVLMAAKRQGVAWHLGIDY